MPNPLDNRWVLCYIIYSKQKGLKGLIMDIEELYDGSPVTLNLKYDYNVPLVSMEPGTVIIRKIPTDKDNYTKKYYLSYLGKDKFGYEGRYLFELSSEKFETFDGNPELGNAETVTRVTPKIIVNLENLTTIKGDYSFNRTPVGVIFYHKDTETINIKIDGYDCVRSDGQLWSPIPYDEVYPLIDIIDYIP